ncbi:MAG: ribosome recycling factor [Gammaproteobacteria bacterium]
MPDKSMRAIDDILRDAGNRMDKAIEALQHELAKVRTGRAHASLLDHIKVEYYGSEVPISQAATISVVDARTLSVSAWDKGLTKALEKAIRQSDLGLNPAVAGDVIRIPLPPLTEERRRDLIRVVRHEAEQARVAIRNIRRDANHHLKELVKDKDVSEDDERRAEEKTQRMTDEHIARVEATLAAKEKELLEI